MGHRVVILGGGFGGLYAAKGFRDSGALQITLIDRRNFHLFQPLLYQVATGELSPADIGFPLRAILNRRRNIRVLLGEAVDIDVERRRVLLENGSFEPYDSLVVATGAQNFYFGHDEWAGPAPGLKSIEEATRIRHRILYAFEAAERDPDPDRRRAWLTFVIVGAGPTGVEMAGAIGTIANDTLKNDFRSIRPEEARILLLDGAPRVLSPFAPESSERAERALIDLGVRSLVNVRVVGVGDDGVTVEGPNGRDHIAARTVIWAAGVTASPLGRLLAERTGAALDRGGRVIVDPYCNLPGHPEIFVIGDLARFEWEGQPLAGVAPVAMQQGSYVAKEIQRRAGGQPPQPFRYLNKGNLAVIGRASAVAEFPFVKLHGLIAWLVWLFVHLMYLVGFQNRVIVFIRWAFSYLTYNRGARLITGEPASAPTHQAETVPVHEATRDHR